jgi:hypothetical protein
MRAEELKRYKYEEQQTPLWIRAEAARPKYVINNYHNLSLDKDINIGWTTKKREVIAYLHESLRLLGEEAIKTCHRRWNSLPYDFHIMEPHSPNNLQLSLLITPWYK